MLDQFDHAYLADVIHPLENLDTVSASASASPANLISAPELLVLARILTHPVSSFLWFDVCQVAWPCKVSPADLNPVLASVGSTELHQAVESSEHVDLCQVVCCPVVSPADLNPVPSSVVSTELVVCPVVSPADLNQVSLDSGVDVCSVDMVSLVGLPRAMCHDYVFAMTTVPLQFPSHSRG